MSRRVGRFFEELHHQVGESALHRWLKALQEGADREEALEVMRRVGRLGPQAQEAAAAMMARLAGSEAELRRILGELERWSRRHELSALTHFTSALRARSSLPHRAPDPAEADPTDEDDDPPDAR